MTVRLYWDDLFLEHDAGPGHPENASRVQAVLESLRGDPLDGVAWTRPRPATDSQLRLVHSEPHIQRVRETQGKERVALDPDTSTSPRSAEAALLAAGAAVQAVDACLGDETRGAFVLCRPPGHHAEWDQAMGFCLFNNVAIGAAHALDRGLERVLVVDPDVHHGNGTQDSFYGRRDILFASSHRYPFYPGSGWFEETGRDAGAGYTVNLALPPALGDEDFLYLFRTVLEPIVDQYEPQLILISAGFDTWKNDPLGEMKMTGPGYEQLYALFQSWADRHCEGRLICLLEGGYDPAGVVAGVRASLSAMLGKVEPAAIPSDSWEPTAAVRNVVDRCASALEPHWSIRQ